MWRIHVCSKLSRKFGRHGLVKPKLAVLCLTKPLRMFDGMDEGASKKQVDVPDGLVLVEHDWAKKKEER